jgi:hypothetical protein
MGYLQQVLLDLLLLAHVQLRFLAFLPRVLQEILRKLIPLLKTESKPRVLLGLLLQIEQ